MSDFDEDSQLVTFAGKGIISRWIRLRRQDIFRPIVRNTEDAPSAFINTKGVAVKLKK
jgi:hypothetical protein